MHGVRNSTSDGCHAYTPTVPRANVFPIRLKSRSGIAHSSNFESVCKMFCDFVVFSGGGAPFLLKIFRTLALSPCAVNFDVAPLSQFSAAFELGMSVSLACIYRWMRELESLEQCGTTNENYSSYQWSLPNVCGGSMEWECDKRPHAVLESVRIIFLEKNMLVAKMKSTEHHGGPKQQHRGCVCGGS